MVVCGFQFVQLVVQSLVPIAPLKVVVVKNEASNPTNEAPVKAGEVLFGKKFGAFKFEIFPNLISVEFI